MFILRRDGEADGGLHLRLKAGEMAQAGLVIPGPAQHTVEGPGGEEPAIVTTVTMESEFGILGRTSADPDVLRCLSSNR